MKKAFIIILIVQISLQTIQIGYNWVECPKDAMDRRCDGFESHVCGTDRRKNVSYEFYDR